MNFLGIKDMNCFPCFHTNKSSHNKKAPVPVAHIKYSKAMPVSNDQQQSRQQKLHASVQTSNRTDGSTSNVNKENIAAPNFTFRELATATKNFRPESLLGEGGFGRVYKGTIQHTGQVVAVKKLDKHGSQGSKEFLVEVLTLSLLRHPNLANLIGYCADGDQRLLVYEYMPLGSLDKYLHDVAPDRKPLDWVTRMKIASGAAQGLEYLHEKANPPIIYRDLKPSNVLLDEEYNPRLSDFGLFQLAGNNFQMSSRTMGTYGYSAPELQTSGELTLKSDVYSFGVVLLELITGRRVIDTTRPSEEQNLVTWAQPIFRDPKRFPEMADPLLNMEFPITSLNQAVGVAAMCLQEEPTVRPLISDIVVAVSFLAVVPQNKAAPRNIAASSPQPEVQTVSNHQCHKEGDFSDHRKEDSSEHDDNSDDRTSEHDDLLGHDHKVECSEHDDNLDDQNSENDDILGHDHEEDGSEHDEKSDSEKCKKEDKNQRQDTGGSSSYDEAAGSSEYSDPDKEDSFVYLDHDSDEELEPEVATAVKWGSNSLRKSKLDSHDGSVGSISLSSSEEAESEEEIDSLKSRKNLHRSASSRKSSTNVESWNECADSDSHDTKSASVLNKKRSSKHRSVSSRQMSGNKKESWDECDILDSDDGRSASVLEKKNSSNSRRNQRSSPSSSQKSSSNESWDESVGSHSDYERGESIIEKNKSSNSRQNLHKTATSR